MKFDDYSLRQIRVTKEFYFKLKQYCHTHQKKMFYLYDEALTWFLEKYTSNSLSHYHASVKNGRCLSLWIHKAQIAKIQRIAAMAEVSDARVIATALILYLEENNILL